MSDMTGLKHASESDAVSEDDKQTLLSFLKKSHGGGDSEPSKNRITLTRKTRSRIKTGERGKTIEVQVRKKNFEVLLNFRHLLFDFIIVAHIASNTVPAIRCQATSDSR